MQVGLDVGNDRSCVALARKRGIGEIASRHADARALFEILVACPALVHTALLLPPFAADL